MYNTKMVYGNLVSFRKFESELERKRFILSHGFFAVNGVWKHVDGRVIGTFNDGDDIRIKKNCHIEVSSHKIHSLLDRLSLC